jgi:hypothetical protein
LSTKKSILKGFSNQPTDLLSDVQKRQLATKTSILAGYMEVTTPLFSFLRGVFLSTKIVGKSLDKVL